MPSTLPAAAEALAKAGAGTIYLAGKPRDGAEALQAAGVDAFLHVGCDLLALLDAALRAAMRAARPAPGRVTARTAVARPHARPDRSRMSRLTVTALILIGAMPATAAPPAGPRCRTASTARGAWRSSRRRATATVPTATR